MPIFDDPRDPRLRHRQVQPPGPCPDRGVLADLVHHPEALSAEQRALFVRHLALCDRCTARSLALEGAPGDDVGDELQDGETRAMYLRFAETEMTVGGRYRIRAPLGRGGMGEVYRAEDTVLGRAVAIKLVDVQWLRDGWTPLLLREDERTFRGRLLREAQVMAQLKHPNLRALLDVVPFGEELAIVMEYVPGATLAEWLEAKERSWREVVEVFLQAGEGLWAAHQAGLVHRDFKPDNVLVGAGLRVVVTDFGLARPASELEARSSERGNAEAQPGPAAEGQQARRWPRAPRDAVAELSTTSLHGLVGTPAYMAPEQRAGEAQDARSDQYSFCVSLYEALYGERPYGREQLEGERSRSAPSAPSAPRPPGATAAPAWLWPVVRKGLSRAPAGRFASMQELLRALQREPGAVVSWWRRRDRVLRERPRLVGAAVAAAVLLLAVSAGAWMAAPEEAQCTTPAEPFAGVWDNAVASRAAAGLWASGSPTAEAVFEQVASRLDEYTSAWAETYGQVCEARVRGGLSDEALQLRALCLEDHRRAVQALTEILAEKADRKALDHAVKAAWLLPPPGYCRETYKLSSYTALLMAEPRGTGAAEEATERERLQLQIKKACAYSDLTKYEQGMGAAEDAMQAIAATPAHGALMPEALFCLAWNQYGSGAYKEALASVHKAVQHAVHHGNWALYRSMSSQLAWWTAYLQDPVEVLWMVSSVNPELVPAQASERYDFAYALAAMGVAKSRQGKFAEAEPLLRRSVWLIDGILGPESPQAITLRANLGRMLRDAGRPDAAVAVLDEAIDSGQATLGRHHLLVGWMMGIRSNAWRKLGRQGEALVDAQEALVIHESVLGPVHPYVAGAETQLAYLLLDQGAVERARPLLTRALSVREQTGSLDSGPAAEVFLGLARASLAGGDHRGAIATFERALAVLAKDPASAWLGAEARLGLAIALWRSGVELPRASSLAAEARRYFRARDPTGRFLASTGALKAVDGIP